MVVTGDLAGTTLYIPLLFYFERNPGLAVPLIALQYHEVKFVLEFAESAAFQLFTKKHDAPATDTDISLWVDYAYLDTTERRKFAQNAHEYLITQHQQQVKGVTATQTAVDMTLNFNHPVKYLMWYDAQHKKIPPRLATKITFQPTVTLTPTIPHSFVLTTTTGLLVVICPTSRTCRCTSTGPLVRSRVPTRTLSSRPSVYSFALRPAEHQPSGTCNFSRIDNTVLKIAGIKAPDGVEPMDTSTNLVVDVSRFEIIPRNIFKVKIPFLSNLKSSRFYY